MFKLKKINSLFIKTGKKTFGMGGQVPFGTSCSLIRVSCLPDCSNCSLLTNHLGELA